MTTRVLVTLQPSVDAEAVIGELRGLGSADVQSPQPELPNVCVATVDDDELPADRWAERARRVPGVATAELDQLRWTM